MDKILVIVITYNGKKWIEQCLGSVYGSSIPLDSIIIDNGSTDGTQDYIKEHFPQAAFHQSPQNLGFGKANNIGLQYAIEKDFDYVYLLNQDAWLMPDTIETLISMNKKHPEFGILSPFQLQANMQHLDVNFASNVCSWTSNKTIFEDFYFQKSLEVYEVSNVMAAHWLISKKCLRKVGGFSPTFPHYGEDDNYADRTFYHGLKLGIVPTAIAVHDREFRETSKVKEIYKFYTASLMWLSNIYNVDGRPFLNLIYRTLQFTLKYNSIKPIFYMFRILRSYYSIKSNNEVSKEECAFLMQ